MFDNLVNKLNNIDTTFGVNIGFHSLILFTFLSVFFVFYISNVSKQAMESELKENIHSGLMSQLKSLPIESKQLLRRLPYDQLTKMFSKPEKAMEMNNKWLFSTILTVNVLLWTMLIFSVVLLNKNCGQNIDIQHILIENGVAFAFIGIVEYLFFTHIALKYVPVEPSVIPKEFLNSLQNSL